MAHRYPRIFLKVFSKMFDGTTKEQKIADALRDFDRQAERIAEALNSYKLRRSDLTFIRRITTRPGLRGFLPLSYLPARKASTIAFIEALDAYAAERRVHDPNFSVYLGTFCWDEGVNRQQRPRIALKSMKRKIYKALRKIGVEGVYHLELEYMAALPGEKGARVNAHFHIAAWVKSGEFHPELLAEELMATKRFPNSLGAPSVDFRRWPVQNAAQIAGLAQYITKWQLRVKKRRQDADGNYYLDKYSDKYSAIKTLRMIEMLSRINLFDAVGAVGDGKVVRKAWKQAIRIWERAQSERAFSLSQDDINRGWSVVAKRIPKLRKKTKIY